MKTLFYMAAMAGTFLLPSCLKNDPAAPADTIKYPTSQGDYWVYKVTNYQKNTVDTVTVSVAGSIKASIAPGNLTVLQLKWPDKIDSQYVSIVDDTLTFYKRVSGYSLQDEYVMTNLIVYPLSMGQNYSIPRQNSEYAATIRMISSQSANINLNKVVHSFTAFREEKTFTPLNTYEPIPEFLIFTDDFVPGMGIIDETITWRVGYANVKGSTSRIAETWQLLYSNLNNPPYSGTVNP